MTSTVFQFLVAGALVMAWIWMLGRPLLTTLARRSRRDSVGHFRQQQAAIGRSIAADQTDRASWRPGLHPLASWRAQPIERRRLQLLLASAIAAFGSLLLAIALRGLFIRLFLLMAIAFVGHVLIAAFIGARELRALEAERSGRIEVRPAADRAGSELFQDRDPRFSEGFFEPIPEFEPIRTGPVHQAPPAPAPTERSEMIETSEPVQPSEPVAPAAEADPMLAEPTFTAPPVERTRPPRRPKARPIFIESELDAGDDTGRAVND